MALRSLIFKMKDLSRPVPGAGAFATAPNPVDNTRRAPWTSTAAKTVDASRYPHATKKFSHAMECMMEQELKRGRRNRWIFRGILVLVNCAACTYVLKRK